jgi:hypothetical protein
MMALVLAACSGGGDGIVADEEEAMPEAAKPNILFVIMDDVGIDQMASFGYGGATPPPMPNINAVAQAGVKFRNTWSMPECSPGRAAFFVGRYPLRTNVHQAIGPNDLANSQLTPYDLTVPKLLKPAGYTSGMFGKFHLAGPENNQADNSTPAQLGWDYFYGWVGGLPGSIDTSAGGLFSLGEKVCGFNKGHQAGACHHANGSCEDMPGSAAIDDETGLQCLSRGGIFAQGQSCGAVRPQGLNFSQLNAYYVSPLVIISNGQVEEVPLTDARSRGYRTTIETNAAIDWIKSRPANQPWMATVSYTAAHTPWQPAPRALAPESSGAFIDDLDCANNASGRVLQNQMTEAMDTEFGRLLVETGLARRNNDGTLAYDPKASNTVIVIVGDNGTFGPAVKAPFDPSLAKGTAYQAGVWVPLIVAGSQVTQPGRNVEQMVNLVDLFQFFGDLAGIDVQKAVPRTIDSAPLLPYLSNPAQASVRTLNFTQGGLNLQANGGSNAPCVLGRSEASGGACTQTPTTKNVCEDNGGVWWGRGHTDASVIPNGNSNDGYTRCWEVNQAIVKNDPAGLRVDVLPETSMAIRDDNYKIVRNMMVDYDQASDSDKSVIVDEFYAIDQASGSPRIENPLQNNLLATGLNAEQQTIYAALTDKMNRILDSQPDCPGDGNQDGAVDNADLSNVQRIMNEWGLSSVYDFVVNGVPRDGRTDAADLTVVQQNLGRACRPSYAVR